MAGFLVATAEAIQRAQCAILGANDFIAGAVGRFNPVTRVTAPRALNGIRRLLGCDPAGDYVPPEAPFAGGQCAGVGYKVNLAGLGFNGESAIADRSGLGPVGGVCFNDNGFGAFGIGVLFQDGCQSSGGGTASTNAPGQSSWQITSIERVDGLPDDCGSVPPVFPPATDLNIDVDVTFSPDVGPDITVNIPVNIRPFNIDFNGDINFPFNFDFGGIDFNGDISFAPEANVTINPPRFGPGSGDDISGQGDDEDGETTPPAEPGEKIIGVVVTATTISGSKVSSYSLPQLTPIFVPNLGSVKFVYSIGGATFFSSDINVKDRRTFIECPFLGGADAVIASPQPGIDFAFQAITGPPIATQADVRRNS